MSSYKKKQSRKKAPKTKPKTGILYHLEDCVAVTSETESFDVAVLMKHIRVRDKMAKIICLERVDKNYFAYPTDAKEATVHIPVENIIGLVSLEATEDQDCFSLSKKEVERLEEIKAGGEQSEPQGDFNMSSIRAQEGQTLSKRIQKILTKKRADESSKEEEKVVSESESQEEEKEAPKKRKATKRAGRRLAQKRKPKKAKSKEPVESQSEEEEAETKKRLTRKTRGKKRAQKKAKEPSEDEESKSESDKEVSESSESSSEEEAPVKPKRRSKKKSKASSDNEEMVTEPPKKSKKKKVTAASRKKAQQTLNPKPHLKEVHSNPILEPGKSKKGFPEKGVSVFVNNREPIYYVCKKDVAGLKKLIKSPEEISTLFQPYSVDIKKNALHFALEQGHKEIIQLLIPEFVKEANNYDGKLKRAKLEPIDLRFGNSGTQNRYQFGFPTRQITMSRGGKEGNMAFAEDTKITRNNTPEYKSWFNVDVPIEYIEQMDKKEGFSKMDVFEHLKSIIRRGSHELAYALLKEAAGQGMYGYSKLHSEVLMPDGEPARVLNISILKKSMRDLITPLHVACINPNIKPLKKLLGINPAYDVADMEGYRLVHYAAACVDEAPLKYLISKKLVNLNAGTNKRVTPLMVACMYGREHNVKLLLAEGKKLLEEMEQREENPSEGESEQEAELAMDKKSADFVNAQTQPKETAGHFAAQGGHVGILKLLADSEANFEVMSSKGWTPLMAAAAFGHLDCVKFLVENAKANPLARNKKGKTVLTFAIINGQLHIVSYLLRLGVHPDSMDTSNNTALHYAVGYGWLKIVKYLVKAGADPNAVNSWNNTPVSIAFLKCHFGIASYLLKLPNINAGFIDDSGRTLAMQLLQNFNEKTIDQLKFIGENTNIDFKALDNARMNALHYLAFHKQKTEDDDFSDNRQEDNMEDIAEEEEEDNKNPGMSENEEEVDKKTPKAAKKQRRKNHNGCLIKCAEYLISKGVDLNQNSENGTPFILALENGNKEFALWMLKQGASIKGKNNKGENVLYLLTVMAEHYGVKKFFKQMNSMKNCKELFNELAKEITKKGDGFPHQLAKALIKGKGKDSQVKKRILNILDFMVKLNLDLSLQHGMTEAGQKKCQKKREQGLTESEILKISLMPRREGNDYSYGQNRFGCGGVRKRNIKKKKNKTDDNKTLDKTTVKANKVGMLREIMGKSSNTEYEYYHPTLGLCNILHFLVKYLPVDSEVAEAAIKSLCSSNNNFDTKNLCGVTPLMLAILLKKQKFVHLLLSSKCDPNSTNGKQEVSCMHLAAATMDAAAIDALIKKGGKINALDILGNTPLHYSAGQRNIETAHVLVKAGANVNAFNKQMNTPFHVSFSMYENSTVDSAEFEDLLFNNGADLTLENNKGRTPFFYAFIKSRFMGKGNHDFTDPIELTTKVLKLPKYDLNKTDHKGNTLLHLACKVGATLSVLTMIKAGAKLDVLNKKKNSPLGNAFKEGNTQLCIYLLQETSPNQDIFLRKIGKIPKCLLTKEKLKEHVEKQKKLMFKSNTFWHAMRLNEDGIIFLLKANGFPPHKAFKSAIYEDKIKLALKIFEEDKAILSKYVTKKAGMNLHCYLAKKLVEPKETDEIALKAYKTLHQKLVEAGVDPLSKAKNGITSVHAAVMGSNVILLKEMLGELPAKELTKILSMPAKVHKDSALEYNPISCLVYDNITMPKKLGITGLKVESRIYNVVLGTLQDKDRSNALCYLLQLCHDKKAEIPKEIAFDPSKSEEDFMNFWLYKHLFEGVPLVKTTLLHFPVQYRNLRMALCFIGLGFSINAKDSEGRTPLMYAVLSGQLRMVELLLNLHNKYTHKQKVDINAKDNAGKTALMYCVEPAIVHGEKVTPIRSDILRRLLECKADPSIKDNQGNTFIELLNKLPGNESYVDVVKKLSPKLKAKVQPTLKPSDSVMAEKPEYDYYEDCDTYLEKKMKKMQDVLKAADEDKVKVDPVSKLEDNAEVVKGDKFHYDVLMAKIDVKKYFYGEANFYKMQLLHDKVRGIYIVWTRWGRIGDEGQYQRTPFKTLEEAEKEYKKIFKQKTGNTWENVENFEKKPLKHQIKELDGKAVVRNEKALKFSCRNTSVRILLRPLNLDKAPDSKLPEEVQDLLAEVIDTKLLDTRLRNLLKRNKSVALAAIDSTSINEAHQLLSKLQSKIVESQKFQRSRTDYDKFSEIMNEIYDMSNKYYELLAPTGYAYSKIPPILNEGHVQMQRKLLMDIYDIEAALKVIGGAKLRLKELHPFDYCLKSLNIDIKPMKEGDQEYSLVERCLDWTRYNYPKAHEFYINSILKVDSKSQRTAEEESLFEKVHNHTLLWHGTSIKNLLGILSQGLRVAPFASNSTGAIFGDAIYFTDTFSKAFNYANRGESEFSLILLCEVALGNVYGSSSRNAGVFAFPPKNYHSVKILPKRGPSIFARKEDGVLFPIGEKVSYGVPYFEENGMKYYDYNDYIKAHKKGKKGKKVGLDFDLGNGKRSREEDEDEECGEEINDQAKKEEEKKLSQEEFLEPKFVSHEIPKANMAKMERNGGAMMDSEYLVFNGAQARVKYMVVIGANKNTSIFEEVIEKNNEEEEEENEEELSDQY